MEILYIALAYAGAMVALIQTLPYFSTRKFVSPLPDNYTYPLVSVIIPARNEEKALSGLLKSLLTSDYPHMEIIVVDDQSTDGTYQLANQYPVKVIQAPPKPEGWVGKSWACHIGANEAQGGLLLFTDADTIHTSNGLRHAVYYLQSEYIALLSAPSFHQNRHWWEKLLAPFHFLVTVAATPYNQPSLESPYAIGQYLLFNAQFYRQSGGHAAIRSSLVEDMDLARMTLGKGAKYCMYTQVRLYSVQMFSGFVPFISGWNRLLRLGMQNLAFSSVMISTLTIIALVIAFADPTDWIRWIPTVIILVCIGVTQHRIGYFSYWGLLFFPVGTILFVALAVGASVDRLLNIPLTWRGRVYHQPST